MVLTRALYRNGVWFFAVMLAAAFWGFWPRYFSNPLLETDFYVHFHGISLTIWCVMLVSQAYFIRANKRELHRQIGKLSYIVGPAVIISTVLAIHNALQGFPPIDYNYALVGIIFSGPILFGIAYGLALYHRRESPIHARYMLCTPLPMIGPIFNRILEFNFSEYLGFLPLNNGVPFINPVTLVAMDLILAGLAIWDWRTHRQRRVFPAMLGIFVVTQIFIFAVYETQFWIGFVQWFLSWPLT